ncbi:hypothetical protein [Sporolactobacillus nakayamae]|uniref:Uncharacterized protein n=1 Tax=Sporolactobacillus nakayamae TaxID=269670 RepID=A0A1I2T439_9BACL|nr:hypothetical protein [Sporolactobacillus nakayamae]SFG59743.1 hypothetical protein SAMN02982927_02157 [Sporolactobacillus nakayamae]
MSNIYYSIKNGVTNLIKWFPVIWKDRDYDNAYLYKLLWKKLQNMANMQRREGHSTNSEEIAEQIEYAANLAHRLWKNNYFDETLNKYDYYTKYPDTDANEIMHIDNQPNEHGNYDVTWSTNETQLKLFRQCGKEADDLFEEEHKQLFDYMKRYSKSWWD